MNFDCDALIVGAGPAGASTAIFLARAGWRIAIAEQHDFPRRKVCGECIAAGNLLLLDELGIGDAFRSAAGASLARIGWMDAHGTISADMPPCRDGPYRYGMALGRDRLDTLLLERARSAGVEILQPARVREVQGEAGRFACTVEMPGGPRMLRVPVIVDAHGSWERGPGLAIPPRQPRRPSDLLAFKAVYRHGGLPRGFLPVLALPRAYGGMVVADAGRTTLACSIRRDALRACRAAAPGADAAGAIEAFLRRSCPGVQAALDGARLDGAWLSVGPLRPGIRLDGELGIFRVGNAAGESHALIGEGISMALQAGALLARTLAAQRAVDVRGHHAAALQRTYATAWRRAFVPRLRLAAAFAQFAMRPALSRAARAVLVRWPPMLTAAALFAGKASGGAAARGLEVETA